MKVTHETTKQEIFDHVAKHLLAQGTASLKENLTNGELSCAYRGDGGSMCAVGCLISDDEYHPDMEGTGVGALFDKEKVSYPTSGPLGVGILGPDHPLAEHVPLLEDLQQIHDTFHPPTWLHHLTTTAEEFELEMPDVS